jgi:prefoldin subunit 5
LKSNICPTKTSDENLTALKQRLENIKQAQETLMDNIDALRKEYNRYKYDLNNINTLEYRNWTRRLDPAYDVSSP